MRLVTSNIDSHSIKWDLYKNVRVLRLRSTDRKSLMYLQQTLIGVFFDRFQHSIIHLYRRTRFWINLTLDILNLELTSTLSLISFLNITLDLVISIFYAKVSPFNGFITAILAWHFNKVIYLLYFLQNYVVLNSNISFFFSIVYCNYKYIASSG